MRNSCAHIVECTYVLKPAAWRCHMGTGMLGGDLRAIGAPLGAGVADTLAVLATYCHAFTAEVPYEPGFLGFREVPAYLAVWEQAKASGHVNMPDIPMFGGCAPSGQLSFPGLALHSRKTKVYALGQCKAAHVRHEQKVQTPE
jgi:Endonuclease V